MCLWMLAGTSRAQIGTEDHAPPHRTTIGEENLHDIITHMTIPQEPLALKIPIPTTQMHLPSIYLSNPIHFLRE